MAFICPDQLDGILQYVIYKRRVGDLLPQRAFLPKLSYISFSFALKIFNCQKLFDLLSLKGDNFMHRTRPLVRRTHKLMNRTHALMHRTHTLMHRTHTLMHRTHTFMHRTHAFMHRTHTFMHRTHSLMYQNLTLIHRNQISLIGVKINVPFRKIPLIFDITLRYFINIDFNSHQTVAIIQTQYLQLLLDSLTFSQTFGFCFTC